MREGVYTAVFFGDGLNFGVNFGVIVAADLVVFGGFLGDGAGVKEKCCAGPGDLLTAGEGFAGTYGVTVVLRWCHNGVTVLLY
jgi:hypothetical protein